MVYGDPECCRQSPRNHLSIFFVHNSIILQQKTKTKQNMLFYRKKINVPLYSIYMYIYINTERPTDGKIKRFRIYV